MQGLSMLASLPLIRSLVKYCSTVTCVVVTVFSYYPLTQVLSMLASLPLIRSLDNTATSYPCSS